MHKLFPLLIWIPSRSHASIHTSTTTTARNPAENGFLVGPVLTSTSTKTPAENGYPQYSHASSHAYYMQRLSQIQHRLVTSDVIQSLLKINIISNS